MFILFAFLTVLIISEVFIAFVIYPLKTGRVYYDIISNQRFAYRKDPVFGLSLKPNYSHQKPPMPHPLCRKKIINFDIRTNAEGFLFPEEVGRLKENTIFCIGDSVTMGSECFYDRTFPAVLDSLVKTRNYRCINAAIGGFRAIHEYLFFEEKILPYKPKIVIVFSGYNDFEDYAYGFSKPSDPSKHCFAYYLSRNKLFLYSALLHKLDRFICEQTGRLRSDTIPVKVKNRMKAALSTNTWLDEWRLNIGKIADLCRDNGIKCFLLSYISPFYEGAPREIRGLARHELGVTNEFDTYARYIGIMNKAVVELCKEKGARCLDIGPIFQSISPKDRFSFFFDRMHFTEAGNRFVAESIYSLIENDLK